MGRKAIELTEEQKIQVEPINRNWSNFGSIVYGLSNEDGCIVYVGATKNPKRRFACYRSTKYCHNQKLKKWLDNQKTIYVHVLHKVVDGLFEKEKQEIKSRHNLFNMIAGGIQSWRENSDKPWVAGTGIMCPSSVALRMLCIENHPDYSFYENEVKKERKKMSDEERIVYEVNLAKQMHNNNRVKKWIALTADRMIKTLEATTNA